jgi:hypothetical protein
LVRSRCTFWRDAFREIWLKTVKKVTPNTTITSIRLTQSITPFADRNTTQRRATNEIRKNMIHVRSTGYSIQILYSMVALKYPGIDSDGGTDAMDTTVISFGYHDRRYFNAPGITPSQFL